MLLITSFFFFLVAITKHFKNDELATDVVLSEEERLIQWFSTFLTLYTVDTVPRGVVTHNHNIVFIATS